MEYTYKIVNRYERKGVKDLFCRGWSVAKDHIGRAFWRSFKQDINKNGLIVLRRPKFLRDVVIKHKYANKLTPVKKMT